VTLMVEIHTLKNDTDTPIEKPYIVKTLPGGLNIWRARCTDCGAIADVPFEPDGKRPVYCKECLPSHRKPRKGRP